MANSPKNNAKPPKGGFVYAPPEIFPGDYIVHDNYKQARADLIDAKMVRSRKYQEQQWKALQIGAHPDILLFMRLFVARMASLNIPVYPHGVVRTPEQQNKLFADGVSKAKAGKGPHVFGCAVDLVHSVHHWNLSPKQWEFFGHVGKELAIQRGIAVQWGGDWPPIKKKVGWDPAHWQIAGWRNQMTGFPWMPTTQERHYYGSTG